MFIFQFAAIMGFLIEGGQNKRVERGSQWEKSSGFGVASNGAWCAKHLKTKQEDRIFQEDRNGF